jgi:hypothetical protein
VVSGKIRNSACSPVQYGKGEGWTMSCSIEMISTPEQKERAGELEGVLVHMLEALNSIRQKNAR